jgi:hypothetical protein
MKPALNGHVSDASNAGMRINPILPVSGMAVSPIQTGLVQSPYLQGDWMDLDLIFRLDDTHLPFSFWVFGNSLFRLRLTRPFSRSTSFTKISTSSPTARISAG